VKILLYGILRSLAGSKELSSRSKSISALLEELSTEFGDRMTKYLFEEDNVESLTVVVNGKVVPRSEKKGIQLGDSDVVELLSPIGGG
jgi:thiamine biosynthesis protein ThiS